MTANNTSSIADKLLLAHSSKNNIKSALTEKGLDLSNSTFSGYADIIQDRLTPIYTVPPRPEQWLAQPSLGDNEDVFYILSAVYADAQNPVAFSATTTSGGNYLVSWGDGSPVQSVTSGVKAEHLFSFDSISNDSLQANGCKQVWITIKSSPGQLLATLNFLQAHSTHKCYQSNFLEILASTPALNSMTFGSIATTSALVLHSQLQRVDFRKNALTSMTDLFANCYALLDVVSLYTNNVTNMNNLFRSCYALRYLAPLSVNNVTTATYMFRDCTSIQKLPSFNFEQILTASSMFSGCRALREIVDISLPVATNVSYLFQNCSLLQSVPELNLPAATAISGIFSECVALQKIPLLSTPSTSSNSNMFNNNASLSSLNWLSAAKSSISLQKTRLGRAALLSLLQNLPTCTAATTLDLTATAGSYDLTDEDIALFTQKNWTIRD